MLGTNIEYMPISIQLPPELEKRLRDSADNAGLDISRYVQEILEGQLKPTSTQVSEIEAKEIQLLEKINLGIPVSTWKRYNYLKDLRDREQLEPDEHAELIRLSDQIEEANAERMKYVADLAKLRKVSLKKVMETLGIKAGTNV